MALPQPLYGDPADSLERAESTGIRNRYGCMACAHRQFAAGDACKLKKKPKPRWCDRWDLDPEWRP